MEVLGTIVNAVQVFETCVSTYKLICLANNVGKDGDQIVSRLQWQYYRLIQWGEKSGIESNTPSNRLNWEVARSLLEEQRELLTSAEKLKSKYNLDIDDESLTTTKLEEKPVEASSSLTRFLRHLTTTESGSPRARAIQSQNSPIRRLRWASTGKEKTDRVVSDIAELNDRLDYLLDSADRERLHAASDSLLRDLITHCSNPSELSTISALLNPSTSDSSQALAAAASLRQIRLLLAPSKGSEHKSEPRGVPLQLLELRPRRLTPEDSAHSLKYAGIEPALYNGQKVIVEWKFAGDPGWDQLARYVRRLGLLLSKMDDPSFHTLPWQGLLPWRERSLFGFVYRYPVQTEEFKGSFRYESLHKVIQYPSIAPLNRRVRIAMDMAETVLQLHTAGWLHKGIRSENIIAFFTQDEDVLPEKAHLVGFEYARPDSQDGLAITQPPAGSDLYRHPKARGTRRKSYRKSFDLYGLGCVLLELALWKPLDRILAEAYLVTGEDKVHSDGNPTSVSPVPSLLSFQTCLSLQLLVMHHAGSTFCDAIALCFEDQAFDEDGLDIQKAVLEKLGTIHI
ncbi:prion-inhibition and propagation-domain-containing protein [Aspergillus affinis]|uniref:prion-inhibition and propagation-domain-containing protein n=1 Tax=Aspergillus affinis TaxID=1070780 RepID=UPI0022FE41EA|nr:prion-inhibition and propagation-domain-containing protein [Aspergillus affinis]KAI9035687.1 prion-inhibition and propagation-domain-containing protein [Aspergillus affinis]